MYRPSRHVPLLAGPGGTNYKEENVYTFKLLFQSNAKISVRQLLSKVIQIEISLLSGRKLVSPYFNFFLATRYY